MLQDPPMGLQTGIMGSSTTPEYRDWHWTTLGLSDFGFTALPEHPQSQQAASDGGEATTFSSSTGAGAPSSSTSSLSNNLGEASSSSLSSYLMDGNVRAMLKKVTVNEGALNQTIQSLGGGEKGLQELMGYIMSWVREQNNSQLSSDLASAPTPTPFQYPSSSSPSPSPSVPLDGGYATGFGGEFYQPCTKARRVGDRSDVYGGASGPGGFEHGYQQRQAQAQFQQGSVSSAGGGLFAYSSSGGSYGGGGDLTRTMTATNTRAARKNRIARQRQSSCSSLPRHASAPAAAWVANGGGGALSIGMFPPLHHHHPPPSGGGSNAAVVVPQGAVVPKVQQNAEMFTFLLLKELRPSDVGNLGRIILPKKEAEMHLPILALREGVLLQMEDFDSGYCWNIRYRFWPNNKSRMYLLENTGEFVKQNHLQEGDLLILYRNQQGNYVLRGIKKVPLESRGGAQMKFAHSLARRFPEAQMKFAHSLARRFPEASTTTITITIKTEEEQDNNNNGGVGDGSRVLKTTTTTTSKESEPSEQQQQQTPPTTNVKAEPSVLVDDDDPFFKEDVMHNIGSTFGPGGILQPLERFPSLNLDFPLDEIMAGIPQQDDNNNSSKENDNGNDDNSVDTTEEESSKSSVKSEPDA